MYARPLVTLRRLTKKKRTIPQAFARPVFYRAACLDRRLSVSGRRSCPLKGPLPLNTGFSVQIASGASIFRTADSLTVKFSCAGVRAQVTDLHILAYHQRADLSRHQHAPVDIRLDDAAGA